MSFEVGFGHIAKSDPKQKPGYSRGFGWAMGMVVYWMAGWCDSRRMLGHFSMGKA
jgi:hypothetical protein